MVSRSEKMWIWPQLSVGLQNFFWHNFNEKQLTKYFEFVASKLLCLTDGLQKSIDKWRQPNNKFYMATMHFIQQNCLFAKCANQNFRVAKVWSILDYMLENVLYGKFFKKSKINFDRILVWSLRIRATSAKASHTRFTSVSFRVKGMFNMTFKKGEFFCELERMVLFQTGLLVLVLNNMYLKSKTLIRENYNFS